MARTPKAVLPKAGENPGKIVDIDVSQEMSDSFLEYAYSVIYSRALPDARDGLKPVQRRILHQMFDMGLRPDKGHVKCARVVGEVMGKLHPHGDGAIYDAAVRLAQPFTTRLPLIDGHGNFGSLDAGPAAMRYTEARLTAVAEALLGGIDENAVDFRPNYDGSTDEPIVLPGGFPNLLAENWYCAVAPRGTPQPILDRLSAAYKEASEQPALREALQQQGAQAHWLSMPDFARFIAEDSAIWRQVVKTSGVKFD